MKNLHLYIEDAINGYRLTFWEDAKPTAKLNTTTYLDALDESLAIVQKLRGNEGRRLQGILDH